MKNLQSKVPGSIQTYWVHFLILFGIASTLTLKGGYTYWGLVLSTFALMKMAVIKKEHDSWYSDPMVRHARAWLFGGFSCYIALTFIGLLFHGYDLGAYQIVLPFLIYPAFASAVYHKRVPAQLFFLAAALGSIGAFWFAVLQVFFWAQPRAYGHLNPIPFGDTCVVLATACIIGLLELELRFSKRRYLIRSILLIGGVAGLLASLLSGSKGGWLSLVMVTIFGIVRSISLLRPRYRPYALFLYFCFAVSVYWIIPDDIVKNRLVSGWSGLVTYVTTGTVTDGSVSIRLELWKAGWQIFLENPIAGAGEQAQLRRVEIADVGLFSDLIKNLNTFDNEYINKLAGTGVLGLLSSLVLFFSPIVCFSKLRKSDIDTVRALAITGLALPILYMEFGLSVAIFGTNAFRQVYASWMVLILALIASELSRHSQLGCKS